jgi:acetyltransferase-like isoleucine patch superfamily enzyme
VIEDYVSVGLGAILLPGVTLKRGSIISAGSVVTEDVPEDTVVAGNPAKFVKKVPRNLRRYL